MYNSSQEWNNKFNNSKIKNLIITIYSIKELMMNLMLNYNQAIKLQKLMIVMSQIRLICKFFNFSL